VYRSCKLVLVLCGNARYMVLSFCLFLGSFCWWCLDFIVGFWGYESMNLWKIESARSRIIFTSLGRHGQFLCELI
jgi:hypothetical protein